MQPAVAQSSRINGYVTDAASGQALELVDVVLENDEGGQRGTVTTRDGLFQFTRVRSGRHVLRASYVGYEVYADTLDLAAGAVRTVKILLAPAVEALGDVLVESERTSGAARVVAGQQTIRPADVRLVPAPDLSGDLAAYLTSQPGIVSSGDRGGQLFIRGGEPSQNLVLLDGMVLYQPFHILGFYSAFPVDILSRANVYAGGYGSAFGERISSVIDVAARDGNKSRFEGNATLSPFITTAFVEGPLLRDRVSFLASWRQSTVERGAGPLIGRRLPFDFGDAFAKVHAEVSARSRLSVSALTTHDRGTLQEAGGGVQPEEIRWKNQAVGLRWTGLPRAVALATELRLNYSRLESEQGDPEAPERTTRIENVQLALNGTFQGERVDVDGGLAFRVIGTRSSLGGVYQNVLFRGYPATHFAFYVEPEVKLGALRVRPGARLEFYAIRVAPYVEPRLRVLWSRGVHHLSAAAGLYHQEEVGLTDQRDAASIFTAWTIIPRPRKSEVNTLAANIPSARHGILGYRITPAGWLEAGIEGFYRQMDNLFVAEWTSYPRFTTRMQPAEGRSAGFDVRVELRQGTVYGYVNYGYSSTRYEAKQASMDLWYGEESMRYRPPHDRRHQLNALANVKLFGFDVSARWEFGSGLPFSRPLGFDGFLMVEDVDVGPGTPWSRRVIYERPFNAELPTYHRLDVTVERSFAFEHVNLGLQAGVINVYDRRNIFYVDVFTLRRADQLPVVPSFGIKVGFK